MRPKAGILQYLLGTVSGMTRSERHRVLRLCQFSLFVFARAEQKLLPSDLARWKAPLEMRSGTNVL